MSELEVKPTTPDINPTTSNSSDSRSPVRWKVALIGLSVLAATAVWVMANRHDTRRLSSDTRVVVRFPKSVFDELTQDEIREEFPILEHSGEMTVRGNAVATGQVKLDLEPDTKWPLHADKVPTDEHAVIAVRVVGSTEKSLVGQQSSVRILGTGRGQFEAVKRIHFDGRGFHTSHPTAVTATHETEIDDVETPIGGPVRLLASRRAREVVPQVNEIAIERIKERVAKRVDEIVLEALRRLNLLNRFDEAIARLHPDAANWRIQVTSNDDYVQAALIPAGGQLPELPRAESSEVEVWVRLTPTQRLGVSLFDKSRQSHRLLRRIVPETEARNLSREIELSDVEEWTRLSVAPEVVLRDRA